MKKLVFGGAIGALLALAGCSDKGADADGDGKVSSEEAQKELSQGGAVAMNPGLWEVKIKFDSIEAPDLPETVKKKMTATMNEMSVKSCLTKEQAEKPGADFFGGDENSNCSFEQLNRSGNKMTVAMTCKPAGGIIVASKMDGSFEGDSYVMKVEQKTSGTPMGERTMKGRIEGKRIGECPA